MPIHDWTRVEAGTFHDFHQRWTIEISKHLNSGILPSTQFSLLEKRTPGFIAPKMDLRPMCEIDVEEDDEAVVADLYIDTCDQREDEIYAARANQLCVRNTSGELVAAIEVVTPGTKRSEALVQAAVARLANVITKHIPLLIIDLFPRCEGGSESLHDALQTNFFSRKSKRPTGKPLTFASYPPSSAKEATVRSARVGDSLPDMPLWLPHSEVVIPLEETYQAAWHHFPRVLKGLLEPK